MKRSPLCRSAVSRSLLAACATTIKVPEIPLLDNRDFTAGHARAGAEAAGADRRGAEAVAAARPTQARAGKDGRRRSEEERPTAQGPRGRWPTARPASSRSKDGYINAIQVYPFTPGALYQVYAAVAQVTDIALEAGEKLVAVSAGDTVRWVVGDTTSGEGATAQVHILVKPIGADLETNLVITTDRRTYHLELRSTDKTYMASVSWTYPGVAAAGAQGRP